MKSFKKKLVFFLGILISIICLYLVFNKTDISNTLRTISKTNYLFLIPALTVFLLDFSLRAYRWRLLLAPVKRCNYLNLLSATIIGFFANSVLPMRAGEVIRFVLASEKEKIPKTTVMATIVVERSLDIFSILVLLSITFFVFPYPAQVKQLWLMGLMVFFMLAIIFYGLMYHMEPTLKVLYAFIWILPKHLKNKIKHMLSLFVSGLQILKMTRSMFLIIPLSIIIWSLNVSMFYFIAKGMGIHQINYFGSIFILAGIALGISVPSSPGYIGVYEYFGVLACTILNVPKESALSLILLTHSLQLLGIGITGSIALAREHLSMLQLGKKAEKEIQ
ncbi:lysylphosphatidylglycerol synthase transmembrane domain-containing protein [Elusimicrobiota bacterium]